MMNIFYKEKFTYWDFIKAFITSLAISLLTIALSAVLVLNLTPLYKLSIRAFNITSATSLSETELMKNYKILISYLQLPNIQKLKFIDFPMSASGEYHFVEVKNIFINLYILIAIISVFLFVIWLIKGARRPKSVFRTFNYTFYILTFFSASILVFMFTNFSESFVEFHHLLFNNDNWIFDPSTDPVILALPEQFFMICGVTILALVIIQAILLKIIYHRKIKNH